MKKHIFVYVVFCVFTFIFIHPINIFAYSTGMDASYVIGQANFTSNQSNQGGSASATTLNQPLGVAMVGSKLVVVDQGNNRVLIYNSIPTSNNVSADVVIGQADMTGTQANRGGSAASNTLDQPYGVTSDGVRLLISDMQNDRILIYNSLPSSNGSSADVVIGQSDMTGSSYDLNQTRMAGPMGIHFDPASGKLSIADNGNNRVPIYNNIPTSNGAAADVVVGQTDFDSDTSDNTASTLWMPYDAKIFNNKLFVADTTNWRVLIFDSIPTTNGESADLVVGQPDLNTANWDGPTAADTDFPTGVSYDGQRLYMSDWAPRVLIYNSLPTTNGESADIVIGQSSFTNEGNNNGGIGANTLNNSTLGVYAGNNLFVSDTNNHRVLIYINDEPGFLVTNKPSGVDMVLSADPDSSVDTASMSGSQTVTLKEGNIPISDVTINFEQDRDWSTVTADTDTSLNKSVINISGSNTGNTGTHTLYIPTGGNDTVRICPNAATLAEVTETCSDGVDFSGPFPETKTVSSDDVTVNTTTINSAKIFFTPVNINTSEYVVAFGLTPGDIQYGYTFPAYCWPGVLSSDIYLLSNSTTYYIQIRAGNGCATGKWSSPLKFNTNYGIYHKYSN